MTYNERKTAFEKAVRAIPKDSAQLLHVVIFFIKCM